MSIHGHQILEMMQGQSYTEASLINAIKERFGPHERFHTCSAQDMDAQNIVDFLKSKGKFKPAPMQDCFTVDTDAVCDHDHNHE